ncbi:MAG: hypothetical protein LC679_07550 [Intrasporangiaceae bacterium]|nr:hypothetical protein [Intrasporangiaceae bacterium]
MTDLTLPELAAECRRLSDKIDHGVISLTTSARESAAAEQRYREAKAQAWTIHAEGTAKEREAQVDAATAGLRYVRDLAEAGRQAALEALRSRRQQLSAAQTLVSALKSELEHSQYGPQVTP